MKVIAERSKAFSLLREDRVVATNIDPDSVDSAVAQRRQDRGSMATELAGPDNTLRQQELAQALLGHYTPNTSEIKPVWVRSQTGLIFQTGL